MKKLIAKRLILYQGRNYNIGEAIPANDPVMTEAWLKAGSAAWEGAEEPLPAGLPLPEEKVHEDGADVLRCQRGSRQEAEQKAAEVLRSMGVEIMDDEGHFVGEEVLTDQLRVLAKDLLPENETVIQPGPVLDVDPAGHFTRESLQKLTKAELADLAEDMKVDISKCRTKPEMVDALAAVSAEAALDGGGNATGAESPADSGSPAEATGSGVPTASETPVAPEAATT